MTDILIHIKNAHQYSPHNTVSTIVTIKSVTTRFVKDFKMKPNYKYMKITLSQNTCCHCPMNITSGGI